jgi:hypothetical protein
MKNFNLKKIFSQLTDFLTRVFFVGHIEFEIDVLLNFVGEFFGCEAHGSHVVCALTELFGRYFHVLNNRVQAVVNVHHWEPRVFPQITLEIASFENVMENFYGVVLGVETKCRM